jgi:hypothetical protein
MTARPTPALEISDPCLDAVIARAERGRAMLERLAEIGMEMVEEVRQQHKMADLHPEPRHDLRKGFDLMARSVRLTLALIGRIDADILAMRKGERPVSPAWSAWRTEAGGDAGVPAVSAGVQPERRRPAGSSSDEEAPDAERRDCETERLGEREFERFRRRLIAGEDYQALIDGDFAACVDEIRAGLALAPADHPPSPEVGTADSRLQGGSRVGGGRADGGLSQVSDIDNPQHRDIPPPGSGLEARVRPPHFGGGRVLDSPDPPRGPPWSAGS